MARPVKFNPVETMEVICDLIARKQTLNQVCQLSNMPSYETVRQWILADKELFDKYARAREQRADARADRIDEITVMVIEGKLDPQAARVVIDAEKWLAGKEKPKVYGDKVTQEVVGDPERPLEIVQRPQVTREEWLAAHGLDSTSRPTTRSD